MRHDWIKHRILELRPKGKSQTGLARALGVEPPRITEIIKGTRKIQTTEVLPLARYLEIPAEIVVGRFAPREEEPNFVVRPATEPVAPEAYPGGWSDVPVFDTEVLDDSGLMLLKRDPIDWVRRSERLRFTPGVYALFVLGSEMSPALEHADQIIVEPRPPLGDDVDCVFLNERDDGTTVVVVRRLLHRSPASWHVRQYNEPRDTDLSREEWKANRIREVRRSAI